MKTKATLAALALAMAPSVALAWSGCSTMTPQQTAAACTEGQVWDSEARTCITPLSS
ncbi:MAG: hypothetical protein JJU42_07530 [Rhodobacteraceae bacterium]|nr:hypothetical protein [Paracoccaceae bacterium]